MIKSNPYEVNGFAFKDQTAMETAKKEAEGIRYIKNSTNMADPDMVLHVYRQMIDQKLFETPVGYSFLHELQEYLTSIPYIKNEDIPAIPVVIRRLNSPAVMQNEPKVMKPRARSERAPKKKDTKISHKVNNSDFKKRFRTSFGINIILFVIVLGMFAVTATSGNVNIVNYENVLLEKYEHWENRLKEREEKLNKREQELIRQENEGASDTTYEGDQGGIIPLEN